MVRHIVYCIPLSELGTQQTYARLCKTLSSDLLNPSQTTTLLASSWYPFLGSSIVYMWCLQLDCCTCDIHLGAVQVPVTCAAAKVLTDQVKTRHELLVDERRIGPWLQCILWCMKILIDVMPSLELQWPSIPIAETQNRLWIPNFKQGGWGCGLKPSRLKVLKALNENVLWLWTVKATRTSCALLTCRTNCLNHRTHQIGWQTRAEAAQIGVQFKHENGYAVSCGVYVWHTSY